MLEVNQNQSEEEKGSIDDTAEKGVWNQEFAKIKQEREVDEDMEKQRSSDDRMLIHKSKKKVKPKKDKKEKAKHKRLEAEILDVAEWKT